MQQITKLLRPGVANAVHLRQLAAAMSCSPREVQLRIRSARLAGAPICSGLAGVYLAATPDELKRYLRFERGRAREIERICDAIEGGDHAETVQQQKRLGGA